MVAGISKSLDSFFLMAVRACVLPRVNEKVLMVRQMWKLWGVSWPGEEQIHIKSRDMPQGISLLLGFQDTRSVRMVFQTAA